MASLEEKILNYRIEKFSKLHNKYEKEKFVTAEINRQYYIELQKLPINEHDDNKEILKEVTNRVKEMFIINSNTYKQEETHKPNNTYKSKEKHKPNNTYKLKEKHKKPYKKKVVKYVHTYVTDSYGYLLSHTYEKISETII